MSLERSERVSNPDPEGVKYQYQKSVSVLTQP